MEHLIRLLHYLVKHMQQRGISRLEADIVIPHPYPEITGAFDSYRFTLHADGQMERAGQPVTSVTERLWLLRDATLYRQNRILTFTTGETVTRAA